MNDNTTTQDFKYLVTRTGYAYHLSEDGVHPLCGLFDAARKGVRRLDVKPHKRCVCPFCDSKAQSAGWLPTWRRDPDNLC